MSASARRYSHLLHTPEVKNHLRVSSKDRFLNRSIQSTTAGDFLSAEKSARYSISYLPGVSEHAIDTGKTLAEAQMKIVVFACEVERLSCQNYELVKENEVLRTQTNKSEREKDLETKLAIVLAENEKLNHIIEDVYNTYMAERGAQTQETYEQRITEILQELEQWKQRCGTLNGNEGDHSVESTLKALEEENKRLNEALSEKDRDVETLRARLEAKGASEEVSVLEAKIIWLVEENTKLKENMKNNNGSEEQERLLREYRDKIRMLLAENDNLSELIQTRLQSNEAPVHEVNTSLKPNMNENVKMAGVHGHPEAVREELRRKDTDIERLSEKLTALLAENEKLNTIVERQLEHIDVLEKQHGRSSELFSKTEMVTSMNEQLNNLLREKLEENDKLKKLTGQHKNSTINSEEFNAKVRTLLEHNDELNKLVIEKVTEVQDLKVRLNIIAESDGITEELKKNLLIVTAENKRLNLLLVEKIDEVEKIRREEQAGAQRRNELDNEDLIKRIRELEATVQDQRSRLQLVTLENERLNSLIGHQLNEGEQIRKRLSEIDHNALKMQELNRTIDILREENERMNRLVMEKHSEAEQLKASRNDSAMLGEVQTKLMLVSQENQRLDAMIVEKIAELDRAKRQIMELEGANSQIPKNIDRLVEENEKLSALVMEKARENDGLKIRLQAVITENDRLNNIALQEARENQQLANKMGEMSKSAIRVGELSREVEAYKVEAERLNSVVIERTIENERLVSRITELQSASVALNDWKAKFTMLSAENERLGALVNEKCNETKLLRIRIGELEGGYAKVTDMEEKLVLVCSENQRVLEEIERLRVKVAEDRTQELEVRVCELLREKDILATHIETLQNEIDGLNNQHVHVVNTLNVNIERHQEELKKAGAHHQRKEEELECKDRRIAELEGDIEMMKKTLDDRARTIEGLEEKLIVKSAEKERLGLVVEEKNREVEAIEEKLVDEMRKSQTLEEKLVDELRKSQTLLAEEIECERRKSAGEKEMLEKSIHMLEEENKKLQAHLNQDLVELEEAKKRFEELEMIRAQELNDFRDQFETLKDISREIKELQVKSSAERVAYETQIAQCRMSIADLEHERDLLLNENERLTALSLQRLEESERSKRTIVEIEEVSKLEINELKSKVEQYKAHMHDIKQLALKYSADKAADQSHINQLKELNESYKAEIKKLYELLDERKVDLENLHSLNEDLRQSQSQLIVRFKQQTETEDVPSQEKLADLQMQFQELEKAKDEYKHQAERNSIELTRRNSELVNKIQQLDVLKMKYEEAFANYQALNFKLFERLSVEK